MNKANAPNVFWWQQSDKPRKPPSVHSSFGSLQGIGDHLVQTVRFAFSDFFSKKRHTCVRAESPDFFLFLAFPQFSLQYGFVDAVRPAFNVDHRLVQEYLHGIRKQQWPQKQFVPEDNEVVVVPTSSVRRPFISLDPPSIGIYQ